MSDTKGQAEPTMEEILASMVGSAWPLVSLDAQVNLVRAQRDEIVATFQVFSAVGQLTARDLDLSVEVYNPEVDYLNVRGRWFGLGIDGED